MSAGSKLEINDYSNVSYWFCLDKINKELTDDNSNINNGNIWHPVSVYQEDAPMKVVEWIQMK